MSLVGCMHSTTKMQASILCSMLDKVITVGNCRQIIQKHHDGKTRADLVAALELKNLLLLFLFIKLESCSRPAEWKIHWHSTSMSCGIMACNHLTFLWLTSCSFHQMLSLGCGTHGNNPRALCYYCWQQAGLKREFCNMAEFCHWVEMRRLNAYHCINTNVTPRESQN